jgi:hypothetical protein
MELKTENIKQKMKKIEKERKPYLDLTSGRSPTAA